MNINISPEEVNSNDLTSQIQSLESIFSSWVLEHIALTSEVIQTIQHTVKDVKVSENILQQIQSLSESFHRIIQDEIDIETRSMSLEGKYGFTEVFPIEKNCIIYAWNKAYSYPLSENESMVLNTILDRWGSVEAPKEKQAILLPIIKEINQKIISAGISIYIDESMMCSLWNSDDTITKKEVLSEQKPQIEIDKSTIYETKLIFGSIQVPLEILTPIKQWNSTKIPCIINQKEYVFTAATFKIFIELLKNPENPISINYTSSQGLYNILNSSPLLLKKSDKKYVLIHGSTNIELQWNKNRELSISSILEHTQKVKTTPSRATSPRKYKRTAGRKEASDIPTEERIDVTIWDTIIRATQKLWARYIVSITKSGEEKIHYIWKKSLKILYDITKEIGIPVKVERHSIMPLKKILWEDFIKIQRGKWYYIGEPLPQEKKTRSRKNTKKISWHLDKPPATKVPRSVSIHRANQIERIKLWKATGEMLHKWFHSITEDADVQNAIIQILEKEPGKAYTMEVLGDIFKDISAEAIKKNFLLAKANFNNNSNSQIIQNTEGAWLLLDVNTVMKDPWLKVTSHNFIHKTDTVEFYYSDTYNCIVYNNQIVIDPIWFENAFTIHRNALTIKNINYATTTFSKTDLDPYISISRWGKVGAGMSIWRKREPNDGSTIESQKIKFKKFH